MMHVAVDGSALHAPHSGIGRYLTSLLCRLLSTEAEIRWSVYCRQRAPALFTAGADVSVEIYADRMPTDAGRIVSLFSSQPWWARRHRPDVFWGPAHRLPLVLPETTARVVTVHDLCWLHAPRTMRRSTRLLDAWLMPRALQSADRIIAVSRSVRDELCAAFPFTGERVVVVHEAAEALPAPMPIASLTGFGVTQPFVLFVGTAEPRKNLASLIAAFARMPAALKESSMLVVAGHAGWGDVDLSSLGERHGVADRIRCLSAIDDAVLATLYRHARLLAMPSLYEGFGLPLVEAMAHGTPVLTSCRGATAEIAGDAALLVDPLDVDAIARGLEGLLTDDMTHRRLSEAAIARAAQFGWDEAARLTSGVLRDAIAARQEQRSR